MNIELYEELKIIARNKKLTYYSLIAPMLGLNMEVEDDRNEIARLLGQIAIHEQENGRPMLTSLVIHKGNDNNPGEGFYSIANELGIYNGSRNNLDRITFWVTQVSLVHGYWKNT